MAYTVLARKYRSQTFDDVVGQQPIAQTLKNAISKDRVAHAYLFVGTRGVGKTTMARIFAKALNCLSFDSPTTEPCCECESCVSVNGGDDIDVIEIDGASNNGVEQVRELRQNAIYRPVRSRYKVYIIDEVHMLTVQAFNALLKILEEPPGHVKFIFATTEPNKVIPTIQSRCQRFDFNNISASKIAEHLRFVLKEEGIEYSEEFIIQVAKLANGSMRDGLSLLDRLISSGAGKLTSELLEEFLGFASSEKIYKLIGCIGNSDAKGALEWIDELIKNGLTEVQIADSLISCMRDLMVAKAGGIDSDILILTEDQKKSISELSGLFDPAGIIYNITTLEKLRYTLKTSETARALLEATVLRFAMSEHFLNLEHVARDLKNIDSPSLKKKLTAEPSPVSDPCLAETSAESGVSDVPAEPGICADVNTLNDVVDKWDELLIAVEEEAGNSNKALLGKGKPVGLVDSSLSLEFSDSDKMCKAMLETGKRREAIEAVLGRHFGRPMRLNFVLKEEDVKIGKQASKEDERQDFGDLKNRIMNDEGVKMVVRGLEAKITGIDFKKQVSDG